MISIKQAELFKYDSPFTMIIVSTNGVLAKDGLVMGRGCALQATKRIPDIRKECANHIKKHGKLAKTPLGTDYYKYAFLPIRPATESKCGFGIFQVKRNWSDKAELSIIKASCERLNKYLEANPNVKVRMPLAGAGYGKLGVKECENVLLDNLNPTYNITICFKKETV